MVDIKVNADTSLWRVRASACEMLALSLRYPETNLADIVVSGEWEDAACEIWGALGIELAADWAAGVDGIELHALRAEATRLFIGAPDAICNPYEGYWRAKSDGVQALMFVNPYTVAVERFYRECGLHRIKGCPNEPLDHISIEFELLQYLASMEAGMVIPCRESSSGMFFGGGAAGVYDEFIAEHVCAFGLRMANALKAETRSPFYRAVAHLMATYLG